MFDPSMLGAMGEMMKNPEMLKQMEEMMKNPEIMNNAMKMMNDPNMANLFGGNTGFPNNQENNDEDSDSSSDVEETRFGVKEKVRLINLKSESYNGKDATIKSYNSANNRYNVYITELDKVISVKEENIEINDEVVVEIN